MLYPHEPFVRWMCAYGYSDRDVETTLATHQIHYDTSTIYDELDWIRATMVEAGGKKDMVPRVEGDPPRLKDGRFKPMTKKVFAKVVGCSVDLADIKRPTLLATMEALNRVRPLRRAVQVLLAKKVEPRDLVSHLEHRFSMTIDPFLVSVYQQYFWPVGIDFADIYLWAKGLPDDDAIHRQDKHILIECGRNDLDYCFWQLGMDPPGRWDEGAFLRRAKQGAARHIQNALNPDLNPSGLPPTQWMACYDKLDELEEAWNERNTAGQADDLYELMSERMKMELPPRRAGLKTLAQVEGDVLREFREEAEKGPQLPDGEDAAPEEVSPDASTADG